MGYRSYFHIVPNITIDEIQCAISEEEGREIFANCKSIDIEMGKYYDSVEIVKGYEELKWLHTDDTEAYIGDAEMILRALRQEQQITLTYLNELIEKPDEERIKAYLTGKRMWTGVDYLFNTTKEYAVTDVWHREYEMFNLVAFYKQFDPDIHTILYTAG